MANKQTNELIAIPALAGGDLFPVYDITEGGSERLKKITADNLSAYALASSPITRTTIKETVGNTPSFFGPGLTLVESSVVTSQDGGVFRIEAGSAFTGVGTGEVQLFLYINASPIRQSQVMPFGNAANGNSTQVGANVMLHVMTTTISVAYTIAVYATTYGVGETAVCNQRFIFTTEYVY